MNQPTARLAPRPAPSSPPAVDVFELQRRIRKSGMSFGAQALLMAILDHDRYGQSRHGCTASLETLAEELGVSAKHVSMLLRDVLKSGWIVVEPRKGNVRPIRMDPEKFLPIGGDRDSSPYQSVSQVPTNRWVQSLPDGRTKSIQEERKEETVAAVRPPDGRPSAPEEEEPVVAIPSVAADYVAAFRDRFRRPELDDQLEREGKLRRPRKKYPDDPPEVTASQQAS